MTTYAAYDDGLRVVDDDRERVDRQLDGRAVECVTTSRDETNASRDEPDASRGETDASRNAQGRVFVGTVGDGAYRSTAGRDRFERIPLGVDTERTADPAVTAVAVSPHDPDEVWIGTEPSRVLRSVDGGDSFTRLDGLTDVSSVSEWSFPPRPETHHVRWIEPCPGDPDQWYVGIEAGALLVTSDSGETWIDRPPGSRRDNHTLGTHPDAPDRVYAAAGDGYAESHDRGATWSLAMDGLDHGYVWGLAVDPDDPDTVFVSAAASASAAHRRGEAYLYRKRGDAAWERLDDRGVPTGEGTHRAALASDETSGAVVVLNDHGLYRTTDAGETFERVAVDLPSKPPRGLAVG